MRTTKIITNKDRLLDLAFIAVPIGGSIAVMWLAWEQAYHWGPSAYTGDWFDRLSAFGANYLEGEFVFLGILYALVAVLTRGSGK
jgi:hypothetical protein